MDRSTITVEVFNTQLTTIDRTIRLRISEYVEEFNNNINQQDLIDIYRIFHPRASAYASFSSVYRTYNNIDHILCLKTNLNKFKRV